MKFDFGNGGDDLANIDFTTLESFATCPRTGGQAYETENSYLVRLEVKGEATMPIKVSRKILDREIPRDQFIKLLETGKTDLIDKFWSKRTKRPFDAYLVLKADNKTGFEFPPRAAKKAAKKTTKKAARKVVKKVAKKAAKKAAKKVEKTS